MTMDADIHLIRNYLGLVRKQPILPIVRQLASTLAYGSQLPSYGDDAAVIPRNGEYLLLATDGMMTGLIVHEPYAAGKSSVMVTVNDIYSMGGRPLGMVNVLASGDEDQRKLMVEGIEKGCHKLRVPMLGGHLHPDAPAGNPALSVAILGVAKSLLRSHLAESGDDLVFAVDMDGLRGCRSVVSWDANSGKSPDQLVSRLEALPVIAERGLSKACKDVSNGGIVGTAAILLENSGKGGRIDLDAIPRPDAVSREDWLRCFQSFGFILAVPPGNTPAVQEIFLERAITARVIGTVEEGSRVTLISRGETGVLFDFSRDAVTGIRYGGEPAAEI